MPLSYVQIDGIYSDDNIEWHFSQTGFPVNTVEIHTSLKNKRASLESHDNGSTFIPSYGGTQLSEHAHPYDEAFKIMEAIGIIPPTGKQIRETVGGATETFFMVANPYMSQS